MTPRSAHARVFADLIADRRRQLIEMLIDYPSERVCGHINGLDEALKLSEEADLKLSGGMSVSA